MQEFCTCRTPVEYFPVSHCMQLLIPSPVWYVPAPHDEQADKPFSETKVPASQKRQVLMPLPV